MTTDHLLELEPTTQELVAIEQDWHLHEAELAVVTAECQQLTHPGELTNRALRRAYKALAVAELKAHNHPSPQPYYPSGVS